MKKHILLIEVAVATLLFPTAASAQSAAMEGTEATRAAMPREVFVLGADWTFRRDDAVVGAEQAEFDDAGWAKVSVPHSWNRVGYYGPSTPGRINTPETINKEMGIGWYRRRFDTPAGVRGRTRTARLAGVRCRQPDRDRGRTDSCWGSIRGAIRASASMRRRR